MLFLIRIIVKYFENNTLEPTREKFKSFVGDPVIPRGFINVNVQYGSINKNVMLFVIDKGLRPILGRDWLFELPISIDIGNSKDSFSVKIVEYVNVGELNSPNDVLLKYSNVFSDKLGTHTKRKFTLYLKEGAKPVFCPPRPIPFSLRNKVDLIIIIISYINK